MRWSTDAKIVALLALAVALLFSDVFFLGSGFYVRDVYRDYLPSRFVLREVIRGGELPLWNRFYSAGQPLAANPGFQAFYPGTWLSLLPGFIFGFNLQIVLHVVLAAVGMYLLLRDSGLRPDSSLFGAIAFALGGAILSLTNLLPFLTAVAWWPLIVMFARRGSVRGLALTLGMMLLAGEVSVILQTAILVIALGRPGFSPALRAVVLALGIGAIQLLPAVDLARDTDRAQLLSTGDARAWSMPAVRPIELFNAHAFGRITDDGAEYRGAWRYTPPRVPLIFSIYCGLLVPLLVMAGLALRVRGWIPTAILALLSYGLAIGGASLLRVIRYPEKFVLFGLFALIVFAATVIDRLDRRLVLTAIAFTLADVGMHVNELAPRMPRRFFEPPRVAATIDRGSRMFNEAAWPMSHLTLPAGRGTYWSQREALLPFTPALYGISTVMELDINLTSLRPTAAFVEQMWRVRAAGGSPLPFASAANVGAVVLPGDLIRVVSVPVRPRYALAAGRVLKVTESANAATVEMDAASGDALDISVTPHRYWHAAIDGRDAPLQVANIGFQRIAVPPGRHTLVMRYWNPVIASAAVLSLLSLIIASITKR